MSPARPLALLILLAATPLPGHAQPAAPEALRTLPAADIVLLGEVHDNARHHDLQAEALRHLQPRAVVWEMLTADQAARLPGSFDDAPAMAAALGWAESGWPDFDLYHPLFLAAAEARHIGAGVPRAAARRAFAEPLAAVFGADAARFGLDGDVPADEAAARTAELAAAHCDALPDAMLPGMLAAQRLRDGALARAALQALADHGAPVAIITGNGHARTDWGVPALIRRADPSVGVLSIGLLEAAQPDAPFDLWVVTAPQPRPDPCAAFR